MLESKETVKDDVENRINMARTACNIYENIWKLSKISVKTKIKIFKTNVKSVIVYGWGACKTTKKNTSKIQEFINKCLIASTALTEY